MLANLVTLIDSCGGVQEGNVKAMNENVYVIKLLQLFLVTQLSVKNSWLSGTFF